MDDGERGEYLTAEQVAAELGVSVVTVRRAFRAGRLSGRKVGRGWATTRRAVDAWLASKAAQRPSEGDVTAEQIAGELGVSVRTIRRAFASGELRGQHRGRWWVASRADVTAWVEGRNGESLAP